MCTIDIRYILPITALAGGVALMCLIQKEYIESRSRVLSLAIMSITTVVVVLLLFIIVNHDVSYICEINPRMYLKHFRMWRL